MLIHIHFAGMNRDAYLTHGKSHLLLTLIYYSTMKIPPNS